MWPGVDVDFLGSDPKIASIFEFYVQKYQENMCRMPEKEFLTLVTFRDLTLTLTRT